jgi:hypothetical protein
MAEIPRVSADETRRRMNRGKAILVCAYEADEKFRSNRLEGAESLHHFLNRLHQLPKDQEIIFYCD